MKKLLSLLLAGVMFCMLLCGCGTNTYVDETTGITETEVPTTAVPVDYMSIYSEVLNGIYDVIVAEKGTVSPTQGQTGIFEAIAGLDKDESLSVVGYTFMDITGDGFSELLVGAVCDNEVSWYDKPDLFAVYTIAHDMPWLLIEGWARSSYYLLDDGTFLYDGSGGASYSIIGNYRMSQGGTSLICQEFYFTDVNEANEMEIYYNTSGKTNKDNSEKLDMTSDEFTTIRTDMEAKIAPIEFTPFSQYK